MDVVFRPSPYPHGIPFGLRSVGHARLEPGYRDRERVIDFAHILWTISGSGFVQMNENEFQQTPGCLAVYVPGVKHNFYTVESNWECRWLTVDGPAVGLILSGFGLGPKPMNAGECPTTRFETLKKRIKEIGPVGERKASALVYSFLAEISLRLDNLEAEGDPVIAHAECMIAENLGNPLMGVNQIADLVNMNRSVFSERFKEAIGLSPKDYILCLRLQKAMSLLKETDFPIGDIAIQAGFTDPNYFAKFFTKRMGMTPSVFRAAN